MNELSVYQKIADPMAMMLTMGKAIEMSGMYGCKNMYQGQLLAMTCLVKQLDPISIAEDYHLIHGRLSMKAERMVSNLLDRGGELRIIERSENAAEIEIKYKGAEYKFRFSWEEAQQEPFIYEGKEEVVIEALAINKKPKIKAKYRTPRSRMQMLWARLISDSVRAVDPRCCVSSYTPEEIEDFEDVPSGSYAPTVDYTEVIGTVANVIPAQSPLQQQADADQAAHEDEIEAEAESSQEGKATGEQLREITGLFNSLSISPDSQLKALAKRGAKDLGDLSQEGAVDLLAAMRAKQAEIEGQSNAPADTLADQPSKADPAAISVPVDGPASETQIAEARTLIASISQLSGGQEMIEKLKKKIASAGFGGLADFNRQEIEALIEGLSKKNLELFFDSNLKGHKPKNE